MEYAPSGAFHQFEIEHVKIHLYICAEWKTPQMSVGKDIVYFNLLL